MKRWLFGLLAVAAPLAAENFFDPCGFTGCWEIGAEALYLKPCTSSMELAAVGNKNFERMIVTKPDYDLGFEVRGAYHTESCCTFVELNWTWFQTTDSTVLKKPFDQETTLAFFPDFDKDIVKITGKFRHRYNSVVLRGGRYLHRGCDAAFYVFGGGRYVDLKKRLFTTARDDANRTDTMFQKSQFSGGGFEAGVGADYQIYQALGLNVELSSLAIIGEQKTRENRLGNNVKSKFVIPNKTLCLPGMTFRIGVNVSGRALCMMWIGEIGYRRDHYFNAIALFATTRPNLVIQDLGFAGPYASLRVRF